MTYIMLQQYLADCLLYGREPSFHGLRALEREHQKRKGPIGAGNTGEAHLGNDSNSIISKCAPKVNLQREEWKWKRK